MSSVQCIVWSVKCGAECEKFSLHVIVESVRGSSLEWQVATWPSTAPAAQNDIPDNGSLPNAAPATQSDTLTMPHACCATCALSPLDAAPTIRFAKARNKLRLPRKMKIIFGKPCKSMQRSRAWHTKWLSTRYDTRRNVTKCHVPATQNDITSFGTLKNERFCSFPHRQGDTTRKPQNRDETCRRFKTSISYETSSNFHKL